MMMMMMNLKPAVFQNVCHILFTGGLLYGVAVQMNAWDRQPVPDKLPPPSQRHCDQYRQFQQEAVETFRHQAAPVIRVKLHF